MDEAPADPSVAIKERMDRFKLRVGDGGLSYGGDIVPIHELAEITQKVSETILGRWNELSAER
jgi:hypothetical protein